jgi:hypothetical protein
MYGSTQNLEAAIERTKSVLRIILVKQLRLSTLGTCAFHSSFIITRCWILNVNLLQTTVVYPQDRQKIIILPWIL